ncbi:MAG: insulinase family protein [Candidatus Latescibacteria bacterium]|nr:insulinase family protein [Candidatus Latescibacterota bacterium]
MHKYMRILSFLPLLFLAACATSNQASTPEQTVQPAPQAKPAPSKHPLDQSEYRRFVLDNGIKVLLVTDPRFNKSAASLMVNVGSLSDPIEREGLAHFLEHMLFMGTKKYPDIDGYAKYISENGGWRNAYTTRDHTNYYFDIKHDAFESAIDRLAQFFIAPLFDPTYTEREINAVHSEFQRFLENDSWRAYQVQTSFFKKGHPASKFVIGSQKTLGDVKREEVLEFYNTYYSADRMSLVLLGKAPLDTLQHWANRSFSTIENKNLGPLTYDSDYQPEKQTFRFLQIEPVKDLRTLELEFPLPSFVNDFESKPDHLLNSLIGHEGKGSLLSLLKKEGLATGLSASSWLSTRDYGRTSVQISLTPKGQEAYKEIIRLCLTYINMLKKEDYPAYHFRELAAKAKLDELYTDRGEGYGYVSALGGRLAKYPLEVVERISYIYKKEDPEAYKHLLSYMRPDNMIVTLRSKGVPTDKIEPHFGTQYSYAEDDAFYATLTNLPTRPELHLPEPNPFMPKQATIPDRPQQEGIIPAVVLQEPGMVLYHATDFEFLRPKIALRYRIRFPKENMNLRFKVLLDTYTMCVNESLNELAYPASLAGLNYSFGNSYDGISFSINGFDESATKLYKNVLHHMQHINISEQTFEALKDRTVRGLKNFSKQEAWQITRFLTYEVLQAVEFQPEERLSVVEQLTLDDIHTFVQTLYKEGFLEALIYGNVSADRAIELTRQMQHTLGIQPISRESAFEQTYLRQENPETLWRVSTLEVNNSCFWRQYYGGTNTPKNRAASMIINAFVDRPFFTELRTNQQLGYIAWAGMGPTRDSKHLYAYFIIQSDSYAADEVETRADTFISTYVDKFSAMPTEQFETLRATAIEELKEKDKTISEKADKFNTQAFDFGSNFKRDQEAIDALIALTKDDVAALLQNTLSESTRRMRTTLAYARDHEPKREVKNSFEDLNTWKKTRVFTK